MGRIQKGAMYLYTHSKNQRVNSPEAQRNGIPPKAGSQRSWVLRNSPGQNRAQKENLMAVMLHRKISGTG